MGTHASKARAAVEPQSASSKGLAEAGNSTWSPPSSNGAGPARHGSPTPVRGPTAQPKSSPTSIPGASHTLNPPKDLAQSPGSTVASVAKDDSAADASVNVPSNAPPAALRTGLRMPLLARTSASTARESITRVSPTHVPALPEYFVDTADCTAVRRKALDSQFLQAKNALLILEGTSGSGKTTAAAALCLNPELRSHAPDGVVWVSVGEHASLDAVMVSADAAIRASLPGGGVGPPGAPPPLVPLRWGAQQWMEHFICLIAGSRRLLVLDDVWDTNIPMYFRSLGLPLIVTTRNAELCAVLNAQPVAFANATRPSAVQHHVLGNLEGDDAAAVLHHTARCAALTPADAARLLEGCSGLALEVVLLGTLARPRSAKEGALLEAARAGEAPGSAAGSGETPAAHFQRLGDELARLQMEINLQCSQGAASISRTHMLFWRTVTTCFNRLSPVHQARATATAVLPKAHAETVSGLQTLWGCSRSEALTTVRRLFRLNLIFTASATEPVTLAQCDLVSDFLRHKAFAAGDKSAMTTRAEYLAQLPVLASIVCPSVAASVHRYLALWTAVEERSRLGEVLAPLVEQCKEPSLPLPASTLKALPAVGQVLLVLGTPQHSAVVLQRYLGESDQSDSPIRLQALFTLGQARSSQGAHGAAQEVFRSALQALRCSSQAYSWNRELCLRGQAAALSGDHALSAAAEVHTLRVQLLRQEFGPLDVRVALALREGSAVALEAGAPQEAQEMAHRSVAVAEQALGQHHGVVGALLAGLAFSCLAAGQPEEAQVAICRSFAVVQAAYGSKSHVVVHSMNDLACILNSVGKHEDAADVLEEARGLAELVQGVSSSLTAMIVGNQAVTHLVMGNTALARDLSRESILIIESTFGPSSQEVARGLHCLGAALAEAQDFQAAKDAFVRCATIRSLVLGSRSPLLAAMLDTYSCMMLRIKRYNHAEKYLKMSLVITETNFAHGRQHAGVGRAGDKAGAEGTATASSGAANRDAGATGSTATGDFSLDLSGAGAAAPSGKDEIIHPDLAKPLYLLSLVHHKLGNATESQRLMTRFDRVMEAHGAHPSLTWVHNMISDRTIKASAKCDTPVSDMWEPPPVAPPIKLTAL